MRIVRVAAICFGLIGAGAAISASAAPTCSTDFKTVDLPADAMVDCGCFKNLPHGTRIYRIDRYDVHDTKSTLMQMFSPDAVFWCQDDGLHVYDPLGSIRMRLTDSQSVTLFRRANEQAVQPNTEDDAILKRKVKDGYAVLDRIL
jgi:hypothetical protein